jgi:hypothetical protein
VAAVVAVVVISGQTGHGTPQASASRPGTPSAAPRSTSSAAPTGQASSRPSPGPAKPTVPVAVLPVTSVQVFGPNGTSDGDNPGLVASVIGGAATMPWHTKWYTTTHFGNLQSGTGLLLDMGSTVTITKVTLNLAAGSADVVIRVGNSPVPGALTEIAKGTDDGGTVSMSAAKPASGRYVEVWFTSLPEDSAGTYEEFVYGVQVTGRA